MELEQMEGQAATVQQPREKVDRERIMKLRGIHQNYISGLKPLYNRVRSNEEWWRLHGAEEERKETEIGKDGGFVSQSAWLPNVVISTHADAMAACPEPAMQPREPSDRKAAQTLSKVVPCILAQGGWRSTWSRIQWQKGKFGAAHYKILWDKQKLGGLGEVAVKAIPTLNLAWKPTTTDIQESPYLFHHEYMDREELERQFPHVEELRRLPGTEHVDEFLPDQERRDNTDDVVVVECWYKVSVPTGLGTMRRVLHRILYTGDVVLYASEDDPQCAERGWYHHGLYPYVFDVLLPLEDSACGLGYIDLGKNPQTGIDLLNTAMIKNAMVGAIPRYLTQQDSSVDEAELLDLSKPLVRVKGGIDEHVLREVPHRGLDGNYINLRDGMVQELRETTGNTESATGNTGSGVTAASAIAALQEASAKISRAAISDSYEAFTKVVEQVIELVRQFYTAPRVFRITGKDGGMDFASIQSGDIGGAAYDISVKAQKLTSYDRLAQNELAIQFYNLGFFDPVRAEQALMCLDMMDFSGKDELMVKISQQAQMQQKLIKYMQLALTLAQKVDPAMAEVIGQDIMQTLGQEAGAQLGTGMPQLTSQEAAGVANARQRAQSAPQPAA